MIETFEETVINSPCAVLEFGEYERVLSGEITNDECSILEASSVSTIVLKCKLANINQNLLYPGTFYKIKRENGNFEVWLYDGIGRLDNSYSIFRLQESKYTMAENNTK
jgi:hypothetical protein